MCANCFTTADALFVNGGVASLAAAHAVRVLRSRRRGITRAQREASRWDADAEFLESLGHDPAEVLGPKPRV